MGIVEIIVILVVALIVIPPENLPDVMRATGKVLRELRLASNMVMRELGGALDQPPPREVPPINTMRPAASATAANIAQTTVSAEAPAAHGDPTTAADSADTAIKPAEATGTPVTHS